ncbi:hypothetical protein IKF30_02775 [Candidatus Saccharibacteria bacterium]|nr:hypothetical protein [Candidatus Saccharibacteria bacterium]
MTNLSKETTLGQDEYVYGKGVFRLVSDPGRSSAPKAIRKMEEADAKASDAIGHPSTPIYVEEEYAFMRFHFRASQFIINRELVEITLDALVHNGNCKGYTLARLLAGEIEVYFNPASHNKKDRTKVVEDVVSMLEVCSWLYTDTQKTSKPEEIKWFP